MESAAQDRVLPHHQAVLRHFVAACQADVRVVATFVAGSYARGTAEAYSGLDLGLVTTDAAYADGLVARRAFIYRLGEAVFQEDDDDEDVVVVFFILADGTDGDLALGRVSHVTYISIGGHTAAYLSRAPNAEAEV